MLRTLSQTRDLSLIYRLVGIGVFTLLTVVSARVSIELVPVPFTLQPLAVLLSGLVLGARDGALSQIAYLALIAMNLPVDARSLGAAAFASPTGGFLIGFVAAAWTAGFLVERGANRLWQRWIAGVAGLVVLYVFGCVWLLVLGRVPQEVIDNVIRPLFGLDLIKALIAAGVTEGARSVLRRE
jgi:biotin transport system substrate-specific component